MKSFYTIGTVVISFLLLVVSPTTSRDAADSKLVMAFMVHRHGDKSPVVSTMPYITDQEAVLNLVATTGYGQLTNAGKRTAYRTGAFIRRRYDSLLSAQYNQSEIFIRSTDSTRTKMTVLTAMSAVYPAVEHWCEGAEWCKDNNWTPVPYKMEAAIYDYNTAFFNCPVYVKHRHDAIFAPAPQMSKYLDFLDEWSNIIGFNITAHPVMAYSIHDTYVSQVSMGIPLEPAELMEMLPLMEAPAAAAMDIMFADNKYLHLASGVLLSEFFKAANNVIAAQNVPKVYVYSAHDTNVHTFMAATKATPLNRPPKYGSLYSLELRRLVATGEYVVAPIYLQSPEDSDALNLKIEGCGDLCYLSKFYELVSKYEMDVDSWRKECEWSEDYNFDYTLID